VNGRIGLALTLALLAAPAFSSQAAAFPVAPLDLSAPNVIVSGSDRMIATYEGTAAYYSSDLFLMLDSYGNVADDGNLSNDLFIFNNLSSAVGSNVTIDKVKPGAELLFRLFVHDTGYNYYSGLRTRNPDGKVHAMVRSDWTPGFTLVSFEDLYGTPQYQRGYNDLSFSFRNTRVGEVPEPHTASLLLAGVFGLIALRGRKVR